MKKLLGFCAIVILLIACQSRSEKAAAYNDKIIEYQKGIIEAFNGLDTVITQYNVEQLDDSYTILIGRIKEGRKGIDALGPHEGDSVLFNAGLALFNGYEEVVSVDYEELIRLLKIPDSVYTKDDQLRSFAIESEILRDLDTLHAHYKADQVAFGQKFNVTFE